MMGRRDYQKDTYAEVKVNMRIDAIHIVLFDKGKAGQRGDAG
jgi:hypothetical protein